MTIPQLRKAFEHMEKFRDVESFRREWKKTFGKDVSKDAAEDYLKYVVTNKPQSGGAAPLDYTTRAGADIPHGSYPEYVSSGFGFRGMDSLTLQGGKETGLWPQVPAGMGDNTVKTGGGKFNSTRRKNKQKKVQKGGGMFPSLTNAVAEMFTRPFGMSSPPTASQDAQMISKGMDSLASPRPEINSLSFTHSPTIYNASINPVSRTV